MSVNKRIGFAVAFSWLNRVIVISFNFFIIPIMLKYMGKEELGIWLLLSSSQFLIGILTMGLPQVFMRRISQIKGKSSSEIYAKLNNSTVTEIAELTSTISITFRYLSVIGFVVAFVFGYFIIGKLTLTTVPLEKVTIAWFIICFGIAINVWFNYLNSLLRGLGYVGTNEMGVSIVSIFSFTANILLVINGYGLIALAITLVITNFLQRFILIFFVNKNHPEVLKIKGKFNRKILKPLIKPAMDNCIKFVGTFIIFRADQYFIGLQLGVEQIPLYYAMFQMVFNLQQVVMPLALSSNPFIAQMWQAGDIKKCHRLINKICLYSLGAIIAGISFLLIYAPNIINVWLGENSFVGYNILITFCLISFFQVQNTAIMYYARATGFEKFALSSLIAGILNLTLTWILIQSLGLWGVSLATLISLMLTDNWYILFIGLRKLKIKYQTYFKTVLSKVVLLGLICMAVNISVKKLFTAFFVDIVFYDFSLIGLGVVVNLMMLGIIAWFTISSEDKLKIYKKVPFLK